ncbi:beta strand repeat-containing protein, partial [Flavobacterium sp.]
MMLISSAQTTKSNLQAFRKNTKDYFRNFLKKRESNPNTLRGSFSKNRITSLLLLLSAFGVQAATITSTATGGTWSTGSTWVGGVAPATGDTVIIATTGTGSVNITTSITQTAAGSVTVNNGAKLTMSSGTLVFGALTVSSGGTITIRRTTTILGATTITGRINFGATGTTARTITFTGAVTLNAGAVWDETNVGTNTIKDTYVIKNSFTNNATTFTPLTGSAHNFTGTGTLSGSTTTAMPTATFTAAYTNNGVFTSATLLTVTGVTLTNNGTITASTALSGSGGVTQGTTGILNIGGASAITTLTATASGNTVNYTGAAQTVHTGNYSTLNFSGSGIKTLATGTTTIGSLSLSGTASTTTVVNMAISNTLTIGSGTTFTTGANFTQSVGGATSITGSLVLGGTGTKTFTGDVTLNAGSVWNETAVSTINFGGNVTNNATTFTANTGGHNFTGATKIISGTTAASIPTATFTGAYTINNVFTSSTLLTVTGVAVTNNGTITATTSLTGTGSVIQGATGILNLGGTIGITTLNAATAGNTVNYTGAGQTGFVTTYSNLILSGSGTKTFATSPTINAVLSMEGTAIISIVPIYGSSATLQYNTATARAAGVVWITPFVATGGIIIKNTGAITTPGVVQIGNNTNIPLNINSGATLTPGANLITFHGDFINAGTLTSGSGGITIGGTTATQSIDSFTTTGAVTLTKTAGNATLTGNANGGALTINGSGGTLNLGIGLTHTFTGIVTLTAGTLNGGSSTLNENAVSATAWNGTASVFVPASGTVNFGAAGNQTIAANTSFYNLGFSNSGTKTFSNSTTVNNNFSISGSAVANLGMGLVHTALSLNLGGASQAIGTWGSTASSALNKNATWFGSSATGTINISCVAPSVPTSGGNKIICSGISIPALTVTVSGGQLADWYNQSSGGTLLLSGSTSYTPSGAGTYYAETRVSATGCLSATRTAVTLTVNPLPTILLLTGNTICASPGGNGIIASTTSQVGVNYQLYNSGNATIQSAKAGTGSALTWSTLAAGNGYYVVGTNATTGCFSTSGGVNVSANANPIALVLTGSTICTSPGGEGLITSSTSQTGVDYQLYDSSNAMIQTSQSGSGSTLTWTDLIAGTGYYVIGTNSASGCVSSHSNSVNISTVSNPIALVLTGSTICASPGGNGTITSTTSVIGVEYQLNDSSDNDIGTAIPGTGAALTFTGVPAGTGYYVDGINTSTGCVSPSSNLVDIATNPNPADKTISVSLASVCTGTGANIIVAGSVASQNYQLRNDIGDTSIGSPVAGNGGTINLPSGNLTVDTTFNVIATITATGCTTEMSTLPIITVNQNNTVSAASSSPTLCINTVLTAITHTTTGATGIGTVTGLPAGVTAAWASNTITISGTPTASGTFNYSIPLTGGCGTVSATGTIIVTPNKTVSAASSSPTLCINTVLT